MSKKEDCYYYTIFNNNNDVCVCVVSVIKNLVLVPVHTKPEDSEKEVDELYDVVMAVRDKWKTDVCQI